MHQRSFEQQYQGVWDELTALLDELEAPRRRRRLDDAERSRLPWLYRQVCNHYALARTRRYSPGLVAHLHHLVLRGHRQLYRRHEAWLWRALAFIGVGFPRALRDHAGYFWLALVLFLGPGLLAGGYCYLDSELIYSILDEEQVATVEYMYDPANHRPGRSAERSAETLSAAGGMAGILLGVGTVLVLLFNGLVLGGLSGHLTRVGYQDTFWSFVSGHGAFELTAIVICGAAGLMLAHAVLAPGQRTRTRALVEADREALKLVVGAALMLVVAAFIEAFWSSASIANALKYAAAGVFWLSVVLYLGLAGRQRGSR